MDIDNRTCKQIKDKLKWLQKAVPRMRAQLNNANNYKNKRIEPGNELSTFKRTKMYKNSQTKWYKLYEEELGPVTELSTTVVKDAKTAKNLSKNGGNISKIRRVDKTRQLNNKQQVLNETLISTKKKMKPLLNLLKMLKEKNLILPMVLLDLLGLKELILW
eukprot:64957_1